MPELFFLACPESKKRMREAPELRRNMRNILRSSLTLSVIFFD
jgi:hypothetical protein